MRVFIKISHMRPPSFFTLFFTLTLLTARAGDGTTVISSTLRSATVYRSGAELVHTATVHLDTGANDLVVGNLSNAIDIASIPINCSSNVSVMSVTFSTDHLQPETVSPFVKKLQDSIAGIKKELGHLEILIKSANELLDLLSSNKSTGRTTPGGAVAGPSTRINYYRQKSHQFAP